MRNGDSGEALNVNEAAIVGSLTTKVGAMAKQIDAFEWPRSALGSQEGWPSSLKTICALMLDSRFPMFVAWGEGLTFLYNDAYAEILGTKHPAALGASFHDVWHEIWGDISPLVDRAMSGEANWIEDLPLKITRHGFVEEAWFTFSYSPARDDTGAIAGMFCAVTETTSKIRVESALRDLNDNLEARIEERSLMLQKTEEHLRQAQKLEAIGQLTGGVAHDFNNLLTVIRGSADLLRRENLSDDKRQRYIDAITRTADRAAKLTAQLLAFARRQALKPEMFDAAKSLQDIAEMARTLAGPTITIELNVPDEHCCILADPSQFDTSIVNMIINARDAMNGRGHLKLTAKGVSEIPALLSQPPIAGDFIAVTVADTGAGIGAENQSRVFEPFFTTKGVGGGTGLGLSQVIGFAKQSGGDIQLTSVEGCGASFTLYLPRAYPTEDGVQEQEATAQPLDSNGHCVLVVEDNEQVGEFAVQALKELGFESVLAPSAERALVELATDANRFDIVFSDVVMPGMSGLDLRREIMQLYPTLPVVLASGYSDTLVQQTAKGLELLPKPYTVEQLFNALSRALAVTV
jgi:signal transduction histidine kinase